MEKSTIHDFWEAYRKIVLPPNASLLQVNECQMAFFGGATAALGVMLRIGEENISEVAAARKLQDLVDEAKEFKVLVEARASRYKI